MLVYELLQKLAVYPADTNVVLIGGFIPAVNEALCLDPPTIVIGSPVPPPPATEGATAVDVSISNDPLAPEPATAPAGDPQAATDAPPPEPVPSDPQSDPAGTGPESAPVVEPAVDPSLPAESAGPTELASSDSSTSNEEAKPEQPLEPQASDSANLPPAAAAPDPLTVSNDPPAALAQPAAPVEGVLVTDEPLAGTGEAVNIETGEVTAPGEPLPVIPAQPGSTPLDPAPEPTPESTPITEAPDGLSS